MSSIGKFTFSAWGGKFLRPVGGYETFRRPGLDGLGVGFDALAYEPTIITTRAVVTASKLATTEAGYRALVQQTVEATDGMGGKFKNVLVVQVRNITWDQLIEPAGSYLLSAEWVLLQDVSA